MSVDLAELFNSPLLLKSARPEGYLRIVLAEAAKFGMPGNAIAVLDDVAAMLGFYEPMPLTQSAHVAGPLVSWRTSPEQPTVERVTDVEELAYNQRALIAFGGAPPGQMVGTAEIVTAMGNTFKEFSPPEYYEVFQWDSLDVLVKLQDRTREQVLADHKDQGWRDIPDDEVLKPTGRLYPTYQTIVTSIRRMVIAAMEDRPHHPRHYLRPLAAKFLESHQEMRKHAEHEGLTAIVERLDQAMATIRDMFPDLKGLEEEFEAQRSLERAAD